MDLTQPLRALIKKSGLSVTEQQLELLVAYVQLLDKWNKAYNLTAVRDPLDMLVKHILASLMNGPHLKGDNFIDVGTGPGLPGIPLAILYPQRNFVLLDSLGKRITFLKQVVYQLKLENVTPVLSRVEKYQPEQLDEAAITDLVKKSIAETGASGKQDMGKMMKALMPQVKGCADGKLVNQIVQRELG